MLVLRNTAKVLKEAEIDAKNIAQGDDQGFLGAWFSNYIIVSGYKYLLFCNSKTLYNFFVPAVVKKDFLSLYKTFVVHLRLNLEYESIPSPIIDSLIKKYEVHVCMKTNSRGVLGTMNDYVQLFEAYLEPHEFMNGPADCDIVAINSKINTAPMSLIKYSSGITEMRRQLMMLEV